MSREQIFNTFRKGAHDTLSHQDIVKSEVGFLTFPFEGSSSRKSFPVMERDCNSDLLPSVLKNKGLDFGRSNTGGHTPFNSPVFPLLRRALRSPSGPVGGFESALSPSSKLEPLFPHTGKIGSLTSTFRKVGGESLQSSCLRKSDREKLFPKSDAPARILEAKIF
ncbi:hypothetical protein CEXT_582681 [Caerostris extrusa]|uniref:Uncharacterized protein n=1 Tax=Caerostris extrusa TaxID=172846 RepID=A0AAV4YDI1_CAEEX|nr:hypothetical protein CEXT_582681 [Caerostris extrusa]